MGTGRLGRLAAVALGALSVGLLGGGISPAATPVALGRSASIKADDPYLPRQWGLAQIGAPRAWAVSDGTGVIIGIVDTGADLAHEDLAAKIAGSTDCVGAAGNPAACRGSGQDDNGHGTHVSGIAAAVTGNGRGVASVAPGARLLVAKVLVDDPQHQGAASGTSDDIVAGIHWVVDHGARVVNLSLGGNSALVTSVLGSPLSDGIEYAWHRGAVPVIASGNENLIGIAGSSNYADLDAIVVGATDRRDQVASYSSPIGNAKWGIVAPGGAGGDSHDQATYIAENIVSTWFDRAHPTSHDVYAALAGTSMATPHVAGAVAVLLAQGLTGPQAVQRLLATAAPISCGRGCRGRLDVGRAVGAAAVTTPPPPAPPSQGPTRGPLAGAGTGSAPGSDARPASTRSPSATHSASGSGPGEPAGASPGPALSAPPVPVGGPGVSTDPGRSLPAVELAPVADPGSPIGSQAAGRHRSAAVASAGRHHQRGVGAPGAVAGLLVVLSFATVIGARRRKPTR